MVLGEEEIGVSFEMSVKMKCYIYLSLSLHCPSNYEKLNHMQTWEYPLRFGIFYSTIVELNALA